MNIKICDFIPTTACRLWSDGSVIFVQYLPIVRYGLFVFLDNVLRTQAVLRPSNLGAGVSTNAVGCEGAYAQKRKKCD